MKKLCVIFGGASCEHDISIITGMQLANNVKEKLQLEKIYLGLDNKFYLATKINDLKAFSNKKALNFQQVIIANGAVYKKGLFLKKLFDIDCVINCCHGGVGENGDLAGFFAVQGVKITSADALASHLAMDKTLAKTLVADVVPTIKGARVDELNYNEIIPIIKQEFSNNLIVKPNSLGSSIGVKVCNGENFEEQVQAIFLMHDDALVEEQITSIVEYNQACIKTEDGLVLSAVESPITKNNFLTFEDKYQHNQKGKERSIPADISTTLEHQINDYTKTIYNRLNLNGVVRIDYIYDKETDQLYFNEVNTVPGSMAFYLFEPVGIDYISLVRMLVNSAKETKNYKYFNTNILEDKSL